MQTLDICLVVDGLEFDGDSLNKKGLGGSETAAIYMARELAKCGNRVIVFSNTKEIKAIDNVLYMPMSLSNEYIACIPHDVTIVQRNPNRFSQRTNSKLNILWCHDLAFKKNEASFKSPLWNIDKVITVSKYHADQYKEVYGLKDQDNLFYASRNGIDVKFIEEIRKQVIKRDKNLYVYSSRPERGLDNVFDGIFDQILKLNPNAIIAIPTYDVGLPDLQVFYNTMFEAGKAKYGDKVQILGSLKKADLYELYCSAGALIYPTPSLMDKVFREVSCITLMEAMSCGLPIVASNKGALSETLIEGAGKLIDGNPWEKEYQRKFAEAAVHIASNDKASVTGTIGAKNLDWQFVAEDWHELFINMIKENNKDEVRLFIDLWRNSDIFAAKEVMERSFIPDYVTAKKDIIENFEFVETRKYKEHYEKFNASFHPSVIDNATAQHRYKLLEQWIGHESEKIKSVLDYACHDGGYTTNLAKKYPDINFLGVDFNSLAIDAAKEFAVNHKCNNVDYLELNDFKKLSDIQPYDCLLMQEVLEHVESPWELVDEHEKYVKNDGFVYITVPYGPWEYDTCHESNQRAHVWHFDRHDLTDMFKDKEDLHIGCTYHDKCLELPDPRGWWIVTYRKNGNPTNKIDMERKLWLQRPRHTVSLNVMAGKGSGNQSRWMLESTKHIVDQYVVADTGMGDQDLEVWKEYGASIIPAPDPKEHGFETPRNIGLEHCEMDFVMWLDTDERLIDPQNILKYLRKNIFEGYGIRQHHFAVDTSFPPDMPVRCFRNKERTDGKKMRFYGMVHEHPETALNDGPGFVIVLSDLHIAHTGYLSESIRQNRFFRNLKMLGKDAEVYKDRLLQKHFIMRDSIQLAVYQLRENGGRMNAQIESLCRDVIKLYQEYFLAKNIYMSIDSQVWYSQALEILNEGFFASYAIETGEGNPAIVRRKFASTEDFEKEMASKVEEQSGKYKSEFL